MTIRERIERARLADAIEAEAVALTGDQWPRPRGVLELAFARVSLRRHLEEVSRLPAHMGLVSTESRYVRPS